ncbi:unnamed protein product, partial [Adineta ricciae]
MKTIYDKCPLTFNGAFGLTKTAHSLKICSKLNQRSVGLYYHFITQHGLKPFYARYLAHEVKNGKDSSTTKLFNENDDVIDNFHKIPRPFNDGTMNLFDYNSKRVIRVPCQMKSILHYRLKIHLKTHHNLPNSIAQLVHDHIKE